MSETEQVEKQEEAPAAVATTSKTKKAAATGNLIHDIAARVENLPKGKALAAADQLAQSIETNYFELGGVLNKIQKQTWFEPFETFDQFVLERFGFASRKAKYLIQIYSQLVDKQIPWEKISQLGWTKLKELAPVLTQENVDEWAVKASNLTVAQLQAVLKGGTEGEGKANASTTDDFTTMKFKLKGDQVETIQSALNKYKAEHGTEFDTVALESICAGYLGGTVSNFSMADTFKKMGAEAVLNLVGDTFPEFDIAVTDKSQAGTEESL